MAMLLSSASVRAWLENLTLGSDIAPTGASNATPAVITKTAHGLVSGDVVWQYGFTTNTACNGVFWVTKIDANTWNISSSYANFLAGTLVAGNGATGAGHAQRITINLTPHDIENMARTLRSKSYVRDTDSTYAKDQPAFTSNPAGVGAVDTTYGPNLLGAPNQGTNLESTIQTIFGQ